MTKHGQGEAKQRAFVVKDIVKKKQDPQQLLYNFFPVVKEGRSSEIKNFQGFPKDQCIYDTKIGKWVYDPPHYEPESKNAFPRPRVCSDCYLRPCVVSGRWDAIVLYCKESEQEGYDIEEMEEIASDHLKEMMKGIFGERYTNLYSVPACACTAIKDYFDQVKRTNRSDA